MKRVDLYFTLALVPLDAITLFLAALAAYSVRFSPIFASVRPIQFELTLAEYTNVALPSIAIFILVYAFAGLYSTEPTRLATECNKILVASAAAMAIILAFAFFQRELFDSRFIVIAAWVFTTLFITIERISVRLLQRTLKSIGIGMQHVVLIGKSTSSWQIERYFTRFPRFGFRPIAHFSSFTKETEERIIKLKKQQKADVILVANPNITPNEIHKIKAFSDQAHLRFIYSAEIAPSGTSRPILHTFAGLPVIEVPKTPLDGWGAIYKRFFDIIFATLLIITTLPLQFLIAIAIKIESKGPILFKQKRVGQNEKTFTYFKFRSMQKNAEQLHFDKTFLEQHKDKNRKGPFVKIPNDPRITQVGKWIRKIHLDEIPEFYNVLLGNMSLVGPRPHMPGEVAQYEPSQKRVLTIKPGITGMGQTNGAGTLDIEKEIALDMHYIENWSPWLDIIILLKTPFAVFEKLD